MTFQLVRATDDRIAIWQTEHGHIYVYAVSAETDDLRQLAMRDAPDATEPAATFADQALAFATEEARARQLIGRSVKRGRKAGRSTAMA